MVSDARFDAIKREATRLCEYLVSSPNAYLDRFFCQGARIKKIVSIGGCPSSGTTLVADLIDSHNNFACGPELGFLSLTESYHSWDTVRKDILFTNTYSCVSGYSAPRTFFNLKYLDTLQLDKYTLAYILSRSSTLEGFIQLYSSFRSHIRNKNIFYFAEKTPGNICLASELLAIASNSYFIYIARHPLSTLNSLIKRGYGFRQASWIWISQNSYYSDLISHPRCILVKYEDVVMNPFRVISNVIQAVIGTKVDPASIESNYYFNSFRRLLPRPMSWRFTSQDWRVVRTGDSSILTKDQIQWFLKASIKSSEYSKSTSVESICSALGYSIDTSSIFDGPQVFVPSASSKKLYLRGYDFEDLFD